MKKVILANTYEQNRMKEGIRILDLMKQLYDALEDTTDEFFEEYDLNALYEELSDTIYGYSNQLYRNYSKLRDDGWDGV